MKKLSRAIAYVLCFVISIASLSGCATSESEAGYQKNPALDVSKDVELRIASSKETWPEMDNVITKFEEVYPNCTVVCEYIEEYTNNIAVRLKQTEEKIDVFRTVNIQEDVEYKDNALNLISDEAKKYLDLSKANPGLVANFRYTGAENTQYAVPYGGEMRGMYVNTTLLGQYGLEVPTNRAELLHCCEVLYAEGYIPFQSSNGTFAQQLLYPYICNSVVNGGNYEEMHAAIENIEPGISEYFRDAYTFLYEIVEKGYFDYKRVEEELGYAFDGSDGKAKDFLNIIKVSDDVYEKQDDIGKIAFLVDTQAFGLNLAKAKSDYHSGIEYVFITSPVGEDGGCAYLSPSDGLAVNNQSDHTDWALEFLNFFFTPEIHKVFAKETGKIPNTADALFEYDIPNERICDVGQMTFSYGFYRTVTTLMLGGYEDMIGISKMNAEKYMKDNGDGTYSLMYTVDDYLARLEAEFQLIKQAR
ncbi:MAG: ABC transporter substrate-binding protein [Clostridia bacterium]|nr:ABC transporter substrate-binding protein [Clostridia bacterium]